MKSGELRQRLEFKYMPEDGVDESGFPINEPILYTKARAKLKTLKGSTFYAAASTNMEQNREFTIRYQKILDDDVRPIDLKVYWKGKEHSIESIENDNGLNETMTVIVRAVS